MSPAFIFHLYNLFIFDLMSALWLWLFFYTESSSVKTEKDYNDFLHVFYFSPSVSYHVISYLLFSVTDM